MSIIKKDVVVLTDVGSADPDDVFTLILLSTMENINIKGVIATHFYTKQRAQMVKLILSELGKSDVPVYCGSGINNKNEYDESDRNDFLTNNPMFPTLFGYPKHICRTEKQWFPNFGKGFTDVYGNLDYKIEEQSGAKFLTELLKQYSPTNKLNVVCVSPVHDLALIPTELYNNMKLYAMGGGFEEDINKFLEEKRTVLLTEKAGYNWGIAPSATKVVLEKLSEAGEKMTLVSSDIVRRKGVNIPLEVYGKWVKLSESKDTLKVTSAVMKDWLYCNRGNKLTQHKNLCDPLTLMLLLDNSYSCIEFHCVINSDSNQGYKSYLDSKNLIVMTLGKNPNVNLVTNFSDELCFNIVNRIENALFPLNRNKLVDKLKSDSKTVFRVNKNTDVKELRRTIFDVMKFSKESKIKQIIGDCVPYSFENTTASMKFIKDNLEKTDIVEWGLTGSASGFNKSYDINHMASQIIDNYQFASIANAVDFHTVVALKEWNATYSRLNECVTVFENDGKAMFGDDVVVTDELCDELICVEGGIQSFLQMINCILMGKPIRCLHGTRRIKTFFSATEFIAVLKDDKNIGDVDAKYVEDRLSSYLKNKMLYDKNKKDACTKQKLFDDAWKKFIDGEVWKKLDNVTIKVNQYSKL